MKIAHITDIHLKGDGSLTNDRGINLRYLDRLNTFREALVDCSLEKVDLIAIGGDMFDTAHPWPYQLSGAIDALKTCAKAPIIGIPGNHDMPKGATHEFTALTPIFDALGPDCYLSIRPEVIERRDCLIITLPAPKRSALASLLPGYAGLSVEEADRMLAGLLVQMLQSKHSMIYTDSRPKVLLAHVSLNCSEVRSQIMDGRDIALPINELPPWEYALLGHIHAAQTFEGYGRPGWICTGSLDLADFGEEGDKKFYTILDTEKGTVDWREMSVRQYKTFHFNRNDDGWFHSREDLADAKDAVVRAKLYRHESDTPDYQGLTQLITEAGAFDFRGFQEEVERTTVARAKEIVEAKGADEYLRIWHSNSDCPVPVDELIKADAEISEEVGVI